MKTLKIPNEERLENIKKKLKLNKRKETIEANEKLDNFYKFDPELVVLKSKNIFKHFRLRKRQSMVSL